MGIYLPNMEMPTDRPQLLWVYPNGKALTVQSDADPWKELQAIPVPPHGDLIDRDTIDYYEVERNGEKHYMVWKPHIDGMPTIIEADGEKEPEHE